VLDLDRVRAGLTTLLSRVLTQLSARARTSSAIVEALIGALSQQERLGRFFDAYDPDGACLGHR